MLDQLDYDAIASDIRRAMLINLRRIPKDQGVVRLGIAQIQDDPAYGKTLMIHVSYSDAGELETSVFALLSLASAVEALEDSLSSVPYASISFLELSDEARIYIKMEDLLAWAHDEISVEQLRQRVIYP